MKPSSIQLILPLYVAGIIISGLFASVAGQIPYENYELVWGDEFDVDGSPDPVKWGYEVGCSVRNSELQYYTNARQENARVENGVLIIEARKEKMGNCNYTSANLVTTGKKSFKYGLFELRAKIDIRAGSWPAWWWLPNSGGWPKGGEIDMMEYYRGMLLFNVMDGNKNWSSVTKEVTSLGGTTWAKEFHTWTWEWDSTKIDLWLDGTLMNHYPLAKADGTGPNGENPFRRPGYMLVNQAIGGTNGGDPGGTEFPVQYVVDYIRYYQPGKDTTAPKIVSVAGSANGTISVLFSESIQKTGAESLSNYTITAAGVSLLSATLQGDERTVVLTASGLQIDDLHELTVKGISDRAAAANTLIAVTMKFTVAPESKKLTGTVIGAGQPYEGSSNVIYEKAVDGNTTTFADCTGDPVWVGYDFGVGTSCVITGFRYFPRNDYADRMSGKSFEVSTDGTTWNKVYTIASLPPEGTFTAVSIGQTEPVRYVRYNGSGGYLNVGEVEFLGFPAETSSGLLFNGRKVAYPKNGSLLQPPFMTTVYTLDGKEIGRWMVTAQEPAVPLSRILKRSSSYCPVSSHLYIVTIRDGTQREIRFTTLIPH